jgi:hypothetical protein
VERSLPSYRAQHRALNVTALEVGNDSVAIGLAPAWDVVPATSGAEP